MGSSISVFPVPRNAILFLVIAISTAVGCSSQGNFSKSYFDTRVISEETRLLADSISRDTYIGTEQMGRLPIPAPAYLRRQALMRNAKDAELHMLLDHPDAIVRLVAFEGLYERSDARIPDLLEKIAADGAIIQYIKGDISSQIPALEYAYVYVMRYEMPEEPAPSELTPAAPKFDLPAETRAEMVRRIAALRKQQ
jgi:hypothetical protein